MTTDEVLFEFALQSNLIEGAPTEGFWLNDHIAAARAVEACARQKVLLPSRAIHHMLFARQWDWAGQYRTESVVVTDGIRVLYRCPPPSLVEPLMDAWQRATIDLVYEETGPFVDAWDVHHAFESIHPYQDGNGRVGRLHMNNVFRAMDAEWITVFDRRKEVYYLSIQAWRDALLRDFLDYADVSPWDGLDLADIAAKSQ